jgi:hypothetical protein
VGDAHTIQVMRTTPLGIQKCLSTLSLKRLGVLYLLVQRMSLVVVQFVVDEPFFLFSFPENYNFVLLVIGISTSILILLISNFLCWLFCKSFICF